jgi:hypothetical protein
MGIDTQVARIPKVTMTDSLYPSAVTLPGIGDCSATRCAPLPVPNLLRG